MSRSAAHSGLVRAWWLRLTSPTLSSAPAQVDEKAVDRASREAQRLARETARHSPGEVVLARPLAQLEELVARFGAPRFRAAQLRSGVLAGARSVEEIPGLPAELRRQLTAAGVRTGRSRVHEARTSPDGTVKLLLQLADGRVVETVGIPEGDWEEKQRDARGPDRNSRRDARGSGNGAAPKDDDSGNNTGRTARATKPPAKRLTVCVSSQVGCPMRCTFCATGRGGFARGLLPHEIVDQVLSVQEQFPGARVTNVVFMGMGEPCLNLPAVLSAVRSIVEDVGIGARHVTLSTVGVPNSLRALAARRLQATLAVSLHAPRQDLRERLVPSAKVYPLQALMADCESYFQATGRRISFEYTLLAGQNDSSKDAADLADLLQRYRMRHHVNLIPWNAVDEAEFERPSKEAVRRFAAVLEERGVPVSVRHTRGHESAAACGQLRNQFQAAPLPEFQVPA